MQTVSDGDDATSPVVEVLLLRANRGRIAYRRIVGPVAAGEHPDDAAARLAAMQPRATGQAARRGGPPLALLHSTSWRYADGILVLTYAGLPDPLPWLPARRLTSMRIAASADPTRPSAPDVQVTHVVAHACRHLAWLAATDPVAANAMADHPDLHTTIDQYEPAPAGGLALAIP